MIFINYADSGSNEAAYNSFEGSKFISFINLQLQDGKRNDNINDTVKRAIAHEVQHAVQEIEGFTRGTDTNDALENYIKTYANGRMETDRGRAQTLSGISPETYIEAIQEGFEKYGVKNKEQLAYKNFGDKKVYVT